MHPLPFPLPSRLLPSFSASLHTRPIPCTFPAFPTNPPDGQCFPGPPAWFPGSGRSKHRAWEVELPGPDGSLVRPVGCSPVSTTLQHRLTPISLAGRSEQRGNPPAADEAGESGAAGNCGSNSEPVPLSYQVLQTARLELGVSSLIRETGQSSAFLLL